MERVTRWRHVTSVLAIAVLAWTGAACGSGSKPGDPDYDNFLTAVAVAPNDGYHVYWLGRQFTVGSLTFKGPSVADFGSEIDGGGRTMSYDVDLPGLGTVSLLWTLYSPAAWPSFKESVTNPRQVTNVKRRTVTVAGRPAQLLSIPGGTRPVNILRVVVEFDDAVLQADASSTGPLPTGEKEANPLLQDDELVNVLQQVRPYPE